VVIADDELLARKRLRQLLDDEPGIEVIAECANGLEAVQAIRKKSPDIVLLDIRMPELDGFGVLEKLEGIQLPAFIFVTAYDRFAMRAFDVEAVDYILKPFTRDRLRTAIVRARKRLQMNSSADNSTSLSALLTNFTAGPKRLETLMVKSADGIKPLKINDISWITAADNYAAVHIGNSTHFVRTTISTLAERLPPHAFARISRSCIVNVEHVQEIHRKTHGDFVVVLRQGRRLDGSRNFRRNLPGLLGRTS
jgi:two-component system LytT family response regulator